MAESNPSPNETPADRLARLQAELRDATDAAQDVADDDGRASTALVPTSGSVPAMAAKAQMASYRANLLKAQAEVRERANAVKVELDQQRAEMEAQMRAALAELAPMQEKVKQMEEGIWTVNLYLGRDEEIQPLVDGEPAPADTPISIRQTVLFMDEEVAALAEDGGMDFSNVDMFDDWLMDPAHRDLLIPEAKGVVAVMPRRTEVDYGNPFENVALNALNHTTYFVIRNGEKLFRLSTEFAVGERLVPNRTEFNSYFRAEVRNRETGKYETVNLEPGSDEWLRAEKAAGARERHFMRIALILQGLIDRTTVFHPIPADLSLLHPAAYDLGEVILIADEEMALTTSREPYREWIKRLNKDLRPGMRIIGAFGHKNFREHSWDDRGTRRHSRITPDSAEHPASLVIHTLDGRRNGGFTFKFKRTQERLIGDSWGGGGEFRVPKTRATCTVSPDDTFIIPLDLVTIEEMETYLNARTERHAYIEMMPLLTAAIAVKKAEAEAEQPFRDLIANQIAATYDVDPTTLDTDIAALVEWWKLANTHHRPLVSSDLTGKTDEAKALRMIVAEWDRRRTDAENTDDAAEAKAVAHLKSEYPGLMYVGRNRDGKVVGFAKQPSIYPPAATGKPVYVQEVKIGITLRGKATVRNWVLPGNRATRMRTLFETEDWTNWDRAASARNHLTDDQLLAAAEMACERALEYTTNGRANRMNDKREGGQSVALMAVMHDSKAKKISVVMHPTTLPFTEGSVPGAEEHHRAQYLHVDFTWSFSGKDLQLSRSTFVHQTDWRVAGFGDKTIEVPWHVEGSQYRRPGLVFLDQSVFDQAMADREKVIAHNKIASARLDIAHRAYNSLEAAWDKRIEDEQYKRFIEDYADADLWEGHKKTLKNRPFPAKWHNSSTFDHGSWARGGAHFKESLRSILIYAVGHNIDLDGLTIAQAVRAAQDAGAEEFEPDEQIADLTINLTTDEDHS